MQKYITYTYFYKFEEYYYEIIYYIKKRRKIYSNSISKYINCKNNIYTNLLCCI